MTETNEPLIVDVDLKESDLQRANFWFGLRSWSNRLMLAVMPLAAVLLMVRFSFEIRHRPFAAVLIFVFLTFPPFYFGFIWFQTKRGFGRLRSFQTKIQYAFSPHGYYVRDAKSSADISWDTILRAAESKYSFHLFFGRSAFHTIPKRCFRRADDIVRLRDLLKRSLGTKATVC
jgi:hypothetical protein